MSDVPRRRAVAFAATLAAVVIGGAFAPYVLRPDRFNDDATQHVYWAYAFRDTALFAGDKSTEFFRDVAAPIGYRLAYRGLAAVGDVQVMSELAGMAVALGTCALFFLVGMRSNRAMPNAGGVVAVVLLLGSRPVVTWLESAMLQRSFAPVALALGMWALMSRRMAWLGASFLVAAWFYPVTLAVLGLTAVLHEAWRLWKDRRLPRHWWAAAAMGVLALAIFALDSDPEWVGSIVTYDQARAMPIFADGGRNQFFQPGGGLDYLDHGRSGVGYSAAQVGVALAVVVGLAVVVRRAWREVPAAAWAMLAASLLLFVAAHLTLFRLYLPNRHTQYSLPLAWIALVAALAPPAYAKLASRLPVLGTRRALVPAALAFLIAAAGAVGARSAAMLRSGGDDDGRALLEYLRSTPPDTLVAGHPAMTSALPLRARRPTLASTEALQGYHAGYHDFAEPRYADSVAAYYAQDWATLDRLADEYGADLFVFNPSGLDRANLPEPYATRAGAWMAEEGRRFVLPDPPADRVAFRRGDWTVVRLRPAAAE